MLSVHVTFNKEHVISNCFYCMAKVNRGNGKKKIKNRFVVHLKETLKMRISKTNPTAPN